MLVHAKRRAFTAAAISVERNQQLLLSELFTKNLAEPTVALLLTCAAISLRVFTIAIATIDNLIRIRLCPPPPRIKTGTGYC
ncbi:MAG: hypothetical protein JWM78_2680 [Verrucomicrobiaceae bacterium]|nr:hypothetical protein [Verrucomicrobiaceae bacterium]